MRAPIAIATLAAVGAAAFGLAYVLIPPATPPAAPTAEVAPAEPLPAPVAPVVEAPPPAPAPPVERAAPTPAPVAAPPAPAAPTTATLRVETDVPGASVLIDRVGVGTAPLTIPNLAPGRHRINVVATGYDGYSEDLDLAPGSRTITIAFKEVKLNASVAAVHKHGIGSCRGQLSATPAGLRYEASDGKDSATIAMADIAAFEMDYLAKNLRVRTRDGKTFNFTDPDGKADPLYIFHAEVDKARKRLASGG